jgi:hypothetical protein
MTETRIEERAMEQHVRRRTFRLLDLTDKSCGGSGVAIKLGKRFFVATAAHVIPSDHNIRILVGEGHDEDIGTFAARYVSEEDDVGLLEIEEQFASAINREFTEAPQLMTRVDQTSHWAATLVGYPGQLVETQSTTSNNTIHSIHSFRTLTLITQLIPSRDWPDSGDFQRRSPQLDSDVFVRFDHKAALLERNLADIHDDDTPSRIDVVAVSGWILTRRQNSGDLTPF